MRFFATLALLASVALTAPTPPAPKPEWKTPGYRCLREVQAFYTTFYFAGDDATMDEYKLKDTMRSVPRCLMTGWIFQAGMEEGDFRSEFNLPLGCVGRLEKTLSKMINGDIKCPAITHEIDGPKFDLFSHEG